MRVAELMQTNLASVHVQDPVSAAVRHLAEAHVSGLPVLDDRGTFVGVVSASDILLAEAESDAPERVLTATTVGDIMSRRPLTIAADDDVRTAARQMLYAEVHRLFVMDEGRLVGVVSQSDIVAMVAGGRL